MLPSAATSNERAGRRIEGEPRPKRSAHLCAETNAKFPCRLFIADADERVRSVSAGERSLSSERPLDPFDLLAAALSHGSVCQPQIGALRATIVTRDKASFNHSTMSEG